MKELRDGWLRLETDYLDVCNTPLWLHAIRQDGRLILLDSGVASTPEAALRGELAAAGLDIAGLDLVINSHAHPDHRGGNAALKKLSRTEFAAPAAEVAWMESNSTLLDELWGANPADFSLSEADRRDVTTMLGDDVRVDHLLRDGDTLHGLTVVTTSGHSPGHIAVHDADRGLLFTFDDVQGRGTPLPDGQPLLGPLYHDVDRYRTGLRRLRNLDFDLLVPSHGEALDREAGLARIDESLAWVDEATEFTRDFLEDRDEVRLRDLAHALGTTLAHFGGVNLQTISMARAHLDHAVRQGAAQPVWRSRRPAP
ncbi:MBL fold metallo-hydrolase [Catenuloplanes japonicus]|uniref:MBL fold metallo-hydrolase n=1 Tax=Catenuloplanes japonicus TaxID=33876 RepID=UPI0005279DC2|nr:MBL fold metallo-hydrolase [Catenuloplanes japonicus]